MNLKQSFFALCCSVFIALPAMAQDATALYARPQGTYFFGLGLSTANTRGYFVPAYTPMKFRNLSQNAISYNWVIETSAESGGDIYLDSSEKEPVVSFPMTDNYAASIPTPTLSTRGSNGSRAQYTYGPMSEDDERTGQIVAGRWNEAINVNRVDFHVGTLTMPGEEKDYVFGTSKTADVHAIGNYFEKPLQTAIIRSIYLTFGDGCLQMDTAALKASGDTLLTMRAIQVERNGNTLTRKDTLATVTTSVFNTLDLTATTGLQCYYLSFRFPEPLVMDSEMLYELDGFHGNKDLAFGIQSNRESDRYEQNAFVTVKTAEGTQTLVSSDYTKLLTDGQTAFHASLMFGLDMMFPVCHTNTAAVACDVNGGTTVIDFETSYAITPDPEETLPLTFSTDVDWVTIEKEEYDGVRWGRKLTLKYTALPEGTPSRTAKLTVKAFAMPDQEVTLTQGTPSGIAVQEQPAIHVTYEGDHWLASYPAGYRKAELLNSAGVCVARFDLTGETVHIAHDGLSAGIYILVFRTDRDCQVVKVIK